MRLVMVVVLILVVLWRVSCARENMAGDPWPIASGDPVPYGMSRKNQLGRRCPDGAICLRRWREPVPTLPGARQVADDVWDRTYASGTGFQLF